MIINLFLKPTHKCFPQTKQTYIKKKKNFYFSKLNEIGVILHSIEAWHCSNSQATAICKRNLDMNKQKNGYQGY